MTPGIPDAPGDKFVIADCPECGGTLKIHWHPDTGDVAELTCWHCGRDVAVPYDSGEAF